MTKRRQKHRPKEIVATLRDADAMLNAGKELAVVLQTLNPLVQPVPEPSYHLVKKIQAGQVKEAAVMMVGVEVARVRQALAAQPRGTERRLRLVQDYVTPNVREKKCCGSF